MNIDGEPTLQEGEIPTLVGKTVEVSDAQVIESQALPGPALVREADEHGPGPTSPPTPPGDVLDFEGRAGGDAGVVEYWHKARPNERPNFIDRGDAIEICCHDDRESVAAALHVAATRWNGRVAIVGGDEAFRKLCIELAAASSLEIVNPELKEALASEVLRHDKKVPDLGAGPEKPGRPSPTPDPSPEKTGSTALPEKAPADERGSPRAEGRALARSERPIAAAARATPAVKAVFGPPVGDLANRRASAGRDRGKASEKER
jgi:hypothetical protein